MQKLLHYGLASSYSEPFRVQSYRSPIPKIAAIAILRLTVILGFQTEKASSSGSEKSEVISMIRVAMNDAFRLMQMAGKSGSCNLARGLQARIQLKMLA